MNTSIWSLTAFLCVLLQRQCCASAGAVASYQLAQISSIPSTSVDPRLLAILAGIAVFVLAVKKVFDTPSRTYDPSNPNVGDEYDSWTE